MEKGEKEVFCYFLAFFAVFCIGKWKSTYRAIFPLFFSEGVQDLGTRRPSEVKDPPILP